MERGPEHEGQGGERERGITSPDAPPERADRPPANPAADERAVREAEDKLDQAGGGH